MPIITASYVQHKGQTRILLRCPNEQDINALIKKTTGREYSKTYSAWHLPCDKEIYQQFKNNLPQGWQINEVRATAPVSNTVEKTENQLAVKKVVPPVIKKKKNEHEKFFALKKKSLCPANIEALEQMRIELTLQTKSPTTMRTYMNELGTFLAILGNNAAKDLTPEDLKRYMLYCTETLKLTENSLHSRLNGFYPVGLKNYP